MDIRQWGLGKIMQLPDWCFGRRWPIIFSGHTSLPETVFYISELALPEKCVIWEIYWSGTSKAPATAQTEIQFAIALADQLPANDAEFAGLENLLPGADEMVTGIRLGRWSMHLTKMRQSCMSSGRRVTVRVDTVVGTEVCFSLGLIVSSVPREVPDWLNSH